MNLFLSAEGVAVEQKLRQWLHQIRAVKIHHLIRYFLLLAIVFFVGYKERVGDPVFFFFMGPPIYLAFWLKRISSFYLGTLPSTPAVNDFGFLLPLTLLYFGLTAFQLKQLWNERGWIRGLSLLALVGFLFYVHYISGKNLSGYFVAGP